MIHVGPLRGDVLRRRALDEAPVLRRDDDLESRPFGHRSPVLVEDRPPPLFGLEPDADVAVEGPGRPSGRRGEDGRFGVAVDTGLREVGVVPSAVLPRGAVDEGRLDRPPGAAVSVARSGWSEDARGAVLSGLVVPPLVVSPSGAVDLRVARGLLRPSCSGRGAGRRSLTDVEERVLDKLDLTLRFMPNGEHPRPLGNNYRPVPVLMPANLLGAAWLQFRIYVADFDSEWRLCEVCGRPFELTRSDRMTCRGACQKARQRLQEER